MNARISPHVLFVTERWVDKDAGIPTSSYHTLFGSFEHTGFGTYSNFFYEDYPGNVDEQLLLAFQQSRPDMVLVSFYMRHGYPHNPTGKSIFPIQRSGVPMVFIWWDAANPTCMRECDAAKDFCTANVIVDHSSFERGSKYLGLWAPQDPRVFHDPGRERDLDVTFAGSVVTFAGSLNADRATHLKYLANSGIPVMVVGGAGGPSHLSLADYSSVYQRSKITLNFCLSYEMREQAKGRLYEAMMCGACVFEQDNRETRRWFEPWVDYVPFTSPEELPNLVRRYLADDDLRLAVAANGKRCMEMEYTAARWWEIVLRKCGLWRQGAVELPWSGR